MLITSYHLLYSVTVENQSLKRERDQLKAERDDLFELAERRQTEISNLNKDWQNMSAELREANNAKFEAILKAEDVASKEVTLQYKEKRMEEEREYLNNQISTLTDELHIKNDEIINAKRDQIGTIAELQADKARLVEAARMAEGKAQALQEDNENFQSRILELTEKLKTARDSELKLEESYRQELRAQTKLAQLYKGIYL